MRSIGEGAIYPPPVHGARCPKSVYGVRVKAQRAVDPFAIEFLRLLYESMAKVVLYCCLGSLILQLSNPDMGKCPLLPECHKN